ncbi:MAG: fold, partial [Thermomicrobiales bacterium]|nr:fold [Thermomicrobiales bacterium]
MGPAPALDFGDTGLAATGRTTMTDRAAGPTPGQQGTAPLAAPYDDDDLFRALGPHPSIGFILVHANGRDVYASERTRAIFGLGPEEPPGERWRTLVHPADRDRVADRWAVARE